MKRHLVFLLAVVVLLAAALPAMADSYIAIAAGDAGEEKAVLWFWQDSGVQWIRVMGEVEFTILVAESNPNDVDTCWIYLNGTTTTGMNRNFTANDFRVHHGMVVIKYDNDEYESKEFRIAPAWDCEDPPEGFATAPAIYVLPMDETAADLIEPVAEADEDAPPYDPDELCHNVCVSEEGCCNMIDPGPDECWSEADCL